MRAYPTWVPGAGYSAPLHQPGIILELPLSPFHVIPYITDKANYGSLSFSIQYKSDSRYVSAKHRIQQSIQAAIGLGGLTRSLFGLQKTC